MTVCWETVVVLMIAAIGVVRTLNDEISVDCGANSVVVRWTVSQQLLSEPSRLFLGNCLPSDLSFLPGGGGIVTFNVLFRDCGFKRQVTQAHVTYKNKIAYRPLPKPKPPNLSYRFECVYKRPQNERPPVSSPAFGSSRGHGSLVFQMGLANDDFSGPAWSTTFPLGSVIPIWAAVAQESHMPLILFLEECVATATPELGPSSQIHPLISNYGCLEESKLGYSKFERRFGTSEILLSLQAFKFHLGENIYIHCKLVVWDPEDLNESKKACHYIHEHEGWELLDDPSRSSLCSCCDSNCKYRQKRGAESGSQGLVQSAVLGPLTIVEAVE